MIVCAKSHDAAGEVSKLFRERQCDKIYAALCFGWPEWDELKITSRIRVSQRRFKQKIDPGGKSARTVATVAARGWLRLAPHRGRPCSLVWLVPHTGRRHQLRLHMASVGHAIVGDYTYAEDASTFRMFLHACALRLPLPWGTVEAAASLTPNGWDDFWWPSEENEMRSTDAWPDAAGRLCTGSWSTPEHVRLRKSWQQKL